MFSSFFLIHLHPFAPLYLSDLFIFRQFHLLTGFGIQFTHEKKISFMISYFFGDYFLISYFYKYTNKFIEGIVRRVREKTILIVSLKEMKLKEAAQKVETGIKETRIYATFPV